VSNIWRAAGLAVALLVATARTALAHPAFGPSEVPIEGQRQVSLHLAHGCGADESAPTIEVAVQPPPVVRDVVPGDKSGWEVTVERDDAGRIETITWTNPDSGEAAPSLPLTVTTGGDDVELGDKVYWKVFQSCGEAGEFRWIGTPDDPAEEPAVTMTLVEADEAAATTTPPVPNPLPTAGAAPMTPPVAATTPSDATSAPTPQRHQRRSPLRRTDGTATCAS
jgi:uncharacterized protein YcnI